jgi:hypothetical protein
VLNYSSKIDGLDYQLSKVLIKSRSCLGLRHRRQTSVNSEFWVDEREIKGVLSMNW